MTDTFIINVAKRLKHFVARVAQNVEYYCPPI